MPNPPRDITKVRERYVRRKANEELDELLRAAEGKDARHRAMVHGALGILAMPAASELLDAAGQLGTAHKNTKDVAYLAHALKQRGYTSAKARTLAEEVHEAMRGRPSSAGLSMAQTLTGARGGEITRDQAKAAIARARSAYRAAGKGDPSILRTIGSLGLTRARRAWPHALLYGTAGAMAGKKLHEQRLKTLRAIHEDDD